MSCAGHFVFTLGHIALSNTLLPTVSNMFWVLYAYFFLVIENCGKENHGIEVSKQVTIYYPCTALERKY